jgi:SAM-dependent methyltransferase
MAAPRNFARYALCYDLLYRDKDYAAEAGYVGRLIRSATPAARSVLEFGCGTGRHARLLCTMGFDVHGVDHSPEMVAIANASIPVAAAGSGVFTSQVGDICRAQVGRRFDAVLRAVPRRELPEHGGRIARDVRGRRRAKVESY